MILLPPSIERKCTGIQATSNCIQSLQQVYAEKDCFLGEGCRVD